jgi:hypothetical protein
MLTSPGLKALVTADFLVAKRPTGAGPGAYFSKQMVGCVVIQLLGYLSVITSKLLLLSTTVTDTDTMVFVICPAISALPFLLQVEIINISDKIFLMENSDFANVAHSVVFACMVQWEKSFWPHAFA